MAMDPFGAILADEIAAQSETWKNIATELGSVGEDLTGTVKADTVSWTGNAADTYRQRAQ